MTLKKRMHPTAHRKQAFFEIGLIEKLFMYIIELQDQMNAFCKVFADDTSFCKPLLWMN